MMEGLEMFKRFFFIDFPTLEAGVNFFKSPEYVDVAAFSRGGTGEVENVIVESGDATH